ncbi:MAG: hypothetical protein JSV33_14740 [bacterium]|nr:MAG: hypothetical protein JSV33_14740 [bacterium]
MKLIQCGLLVMLLFSVTVTGTARAFEGFRGSTWGELRWDLPREGEDNLIFNGWFKQGIDWMRSGNTTLNTYAVLRYKWDIEEYDWNNAIAPGVGISLDTYSPGGVIATLGFEYQWEKLLYGPDTMYHKAVIYVNWVGWWDLKK